MENCDHRHVTKNLLIFVTVDDYKDIIIKTEHESRYCPGTKISPHFIKTHVCRSSTRKAQDMRAKLQEINKEYSADIECCWLRVKVYQSESR
uniref:Uncharacterized protein n=1 Tax=Glossina palpalis gambiensis TaxID=67801 RepID=A0A1B0AYP8_9MUSC